MKESSDSVIFQLSHQFWGFESFSLNGCNEINPINPKKTRIQKRREYSINKTRIWDETSFEEKNYSLSHFAHLISSWWYKISIFSGAPHEKNTLPCCTKYGNLKWGITRKYPWRRLQCCTRVNPLNDAKKAGGTRFVISNFLLRTHIYDQQIFSLIPIFLICLFHNLQVK